MACMINVANTFPVQLPHMEMQLSLPKQSQPTVHCGQHRHLLAFVGMQLGQVTVSRFADRQLMLLSSSFVPFASRDANSNCCLQHLQQAVADLGNGRNWQLAMQLESNKTQNTNARRCIKCSSNSPKRDRQRHEGGEGEGGGVYCR